MFAQTLNILRCILLCTWDENGVIPTREKWRKAFFVVSQINGFELNTYNGYLLQKYVNAESFVIPRPSGQRNMGR
uniref:Uncharacterized protein n=1 Tax=Picea sitchensis TaxID=3332 RepID=D5AE53_PICSI|nr:unknown [Picea sitchensis]